ncbi:Protease synthase and sporulation protein PAI 2 [Aliiroseovarius pelagivivens]|uniref:Protease synthase and sporulation protein PAI 2 n=1 Tax=Aliiroseovarius pelagivivens TaxID=1639690 RepID=A0A2R8ASW3_9RHOB|nr:FMN-binding negative transcriptional regulator [Aliiroseovarius pelagivivens]SPF79128.1 Protease synthase and sporulation protein PAI 2 [Aliiroseovarius pelagivivens]
MHPNPVFRRSERDQNIAFAQNRAFGTLCVAGETPLLSHIPFLLSDDGSLAEFHLVRSNPIARVGETNAVIAVTGPDGYVSPDWYGADQQVPTWNYVAVHLRGRLVPLEQDALHDILVRQAADYEARIEGKAPWTFDKMTPEVIAKMERMIVPMRLEVETIDGTWKLGQNKDDPMREAAAAQMHTGFGQELAEIAKLMGEPPA